MIDTDDAETWPSSVRERVRIHAGLQSRNGRARRSSNVELVEGEVELRGLLSGGKVLAFHCTRLLPHEVDGIRAEGLRLLTDDLVETRIAAAFDAGYVDASERELISSSTLLALGERENRVDQICFSLGRAALEDTSGCHLLLSNWGGEVIYWKDVDEPHRWMSIGSPSVVAAQLDVSSRDLSFISPSLGELLVGTVLQDDPRHAGVNYYAPVPASDIVGIWQPGDADYDRHQSLPR